MAAVVSIISRCGLSIDVHHGNQNNKIKLVLFKPLVHFSSCLKWLYISNKTEYFNYKGGYGVCWRHTHIEAFKRRADLGCR